jgi:hypothetical protein
MGRWDILINEWTSQRKPVTIRFIDGSTAEGRLLEVDSNGKWWLLEHHHNKNEFAVYPQAFRSVEEDLFPPMAASAE